jgi:hypothetical protein
MERIHMYLTNDVIAALLVALALGVLLAPVIRYVIAGWRAERHDIMDGLDENARLEYFKMFCRTGRPTSAKDASTAFEAMYAKGFGRRYFVMPIILLTLVGLVAATLVVVTVLHTERFIANPFFDLNPTAIAAIAGAYMWTVNDLISRSRRLDMSASDVLWSVLRLTISVPMGFAFAAVASDSAGPFVAFGLGAFPLEALTSKLGRLTDKALGLQATAVEASDNIIRLQGINPTIVERLQNEDISTVTQVAYCDPVRVTMRSNLSFNFVTDCMNQALAWMYFEDDLDKLRPLGMRGAVEIKCLVDAYDDLDVAGAAARACAVAALPKMAAAIGQDSSTLLITFRQISDDPFTDFLSSVWT